VKQRTDLTQIEVKRHVKSEEIVADCVGNER
jgi:hypothetical protein